jgi:hypothetical protein
MIWAKTLPGKISRQRWRQAGDEVSFSLPFRSLNQSLLWTFYERTATALHDFTPREPNQLPLRKGCQICEWSFDVCHDAWLTHRFFSCLFPFRHHQQRGRQSVSTNWHFSLLLHLSLNEKCFYRPQWMAKRSLNGPGEFMKPHFPLHWLTFHLILSDWILPQKFRSRELLGWGTMIHRRVLQHVVRRLHRAACINPVITRKKSKFCGRYKVQRGKTNIFSRITKKSLKFF